jgi:putative component of membrane protein insertase Oxa1/YidC/SpoIIIJ protein YidD
MKSLGIGTNYSFKNRLLFPHVIAHDQLCIFLQQCSKTSMKTYQVLSPWVITIAITLTWMCIHCQRELEVIAIFKVQVLLDLFLAQNTSTLFSFYPKCSHYNLELDQMFSLVIANWWNHPFISIFSVCPPIAHLATPCN